MGWRCSDVPQEIVEGLRAGRVDSVGDLAAFIESHGHPDEALSEALQQVYLRLIKRFRRRRADGESNRLPDVTALLGSMLSWQRLDDLRARKRYESALAAAAALKGARGDRSPLNAACTHEELTGMWRALQHIKEPDQTTLWFHVFWGMSHRMIGVMLGLSEGTVKSMVSRARKQIRQELEQGGLSSAAGR